MARYLATWAVSLIVLLAALAAFCIAVDPYAVIGTKLVAGWNAQKPAASDWPRLTKAYTVLRAHPRTIILGNSSADVGFDPESPSWPSDAKPVFNLAIDGGLPATHLRYLQHALSATTPTRIIVATSFVESVAWPVARVSAATQGQFDFDPRLRVLASGAPNPGYARAYLADMLFATLSFDAVTDSIMTVLDQNNPTATYETALGFNTGGKFLRWARDEGYNSIVMNKDDEKVPQLIAWRTTARMVQSDPVFDMVRLGLSRGAHVTVVILPNYVDGLEWYRQLGLDPAVDAWKARLARGVAAAAPHGGAELWDFSGYSPYTTEALPAAGDRVHGMRWFYEPIHFQPALGSLMIARILGAAAPADLGTQLTPANLAAQLAAYHAGQARWVGAHPRDVARVGRIVRGGAAF